MVKCLITDVVIKPEEHSLYFSILFQRITKCLIKPLVVLILELVVPVSSKMIPGQEFSFEALKSQGCCQGRLESLGWDGFALSGFALHSSAKPCVDS